MKAQIGNYMCSEVAHWVDLEDVGYRTWMVEWVLAYSSTAQTGM